MGCLAGLAEVLDFVLAFVLLTINDSMSMPFSCSSLFTSPMYRTAYEPVSWLTTTVGSLLAACTAVWSVFAVIDIDAVHACSLFSACAGPRAMKEASQSGLLHVEHRSMMGGMETSSPPRLRCFGRCGVVVWWET